MARHAWGVGLATIAADGTTLDTFYRHLGFADAVPAGTPIESKTVTDERRGVARFEVRHQSGEKQFDAVIVVACPREMQLQRVMERNRLSKEDAERRLAAQLPIEKKLEKATYVIRTDGTFEDSNAQIAALLDTLKDGKSRA